MKNIVLLGICFLLFHSQALGATIYAKEDPGHANMVCYKADAWPATDCSDADVDNTDIEAALAAAGAGGTLYLDGGNSGITYSGTELDGDSALLIDENGITMSATTDAGHNGQVTIAQAGAAHGIDVNTTCTIMGTAANFLKVSFTSNTAWKEPIDIGSGVCTLKYIHIDNAGTGAGAHAITAWGSSGPHIISHCLIENIFAATGSGLYCNNAQANISYCIFKGSRGDGQIYSIGTDADAINIYNTLLLDSYGRAVYGNNANATIELKNCVITGARGTISYPIVYEDAGTINLTNCAYFHKFSTPRSNAYDITNGAVTNCLENQFPNFVSYQRDGCVVAVLDDAGNYDHAQATDAVFDSYGKHFTWVVDVNGMDGAKWAIAQALIQEGDDIGAHTASHTQMTLTDALDFSQAGGANCTVANDGTTITCNCDDAEYDQTSTSITAATIITDLNGNKGWTVAKNDVAISNSLALSSLATQGATAEPCSIALEKTDTDCSDGCAGFYNDEVVVPKATIETQIQALGGAYAAWACETFACPYSLYDANVKSAIRTAGFHFNRGIIGSGNSAWCLDDIDMFNGAAAFSPATIGSTGAEVRSSARNLAFQIKQMGLVISLMLHDESGWAISGDTALLDAFLDELIKYGVKIYSAKEFVDWIEGGDWADDGDGTWSRTWVDGSDFHLTPNSPCIDAGTDLGATYANDFDGYSQYGDGRWDIGAKRFLKWGGMDF